MPKRFHVMVCDDSADTDPSVKDYCDALADEYQRKTESHELGRCSSNEFHRMFSFSLKKFSSGLSVTPTGCLLLLYRCPTTKIRVRNWLTVCAMTDNSVKSLWGTLWYMRWLVVACASQTEWPTSTYPPLWPHGTPMSNGTSCALTNLAQ